MSEPTADDRQPPPGEADRNVWNVDSITARLTTAERRVTDWEQWYRDMLADFRGVTCDENDPHRFHSWDWIEQHRPPPFVEPPPAMTIEEQMAPKGPTL